MRGRACAALEDVGIADAFADRLHSFAYGMRTFVACHLERQRHLAQVVVEQPQMPVNTLRGSVLIEKNPHSLRSGFKRGASQHVVGARRIAHDHALEHRLWSDDVRPNDEVVGRRHQAGPRPGRALLPSIRLVIGGQRGCGQRITDLIRHARRQPRRVRSGHPPRDLGFRDLPNLLAHFRTVFGTADIKVPRRYETGGRGGMSGALDRDEPYR